MKAQIIKADGAKVEVTPQRGSSFSEEELIKIVGGKTEKHRLKWGGVMVLNEDGYSLRLPINLEATFIFSQNVTYGIINGDVLICEDSQIA